VLVTGVLRRSRGSITTGLRRAVNSLRAVRELAIGVALGLAAGVAAGPLLALVLGAALERGFRAGARVAAAPLLSDAPIVLLSVLVLEGVPDALVAACSIAGGAFVVYLGVSELRGAAPAPRAEAPGAGRRDVLRAVWVNLLNPHPWLFWLGVGGPLLVRAADHSHAAAAAFLLGFYTVMVGTKVFLAAAVAAGRRRLLAGRGYAIALRGTASLMIAVGLLLAIEGLRAL
jgi:threonine/homoserine/homoserine lactone efflux protein